jgi:hypothetical protein
LRAGCESDEDLPKAFSRSTPFQRKEGTENAPQVEVCPACGSEAGKNAGSWKRVLRGSMNGKFQPRDLVYNRNTTEDGAIRKVYETHGATMYEVAVPMHGDAWASGFCISDWAEDVLQLSDNVRLKSATLAVLASNLFVL